ncbi:MAG: helix-turn-helix transcriptional regulator [Chloroflexota bacterium]
MNLLNGFKIKTLREQKHWEQQDLARAAGTARSVISRLERGLQNDFKLSVVVAIAMALGVSIDSLLDESFQIVKPSFTPELQMALAELSHQPEKIQNHIAGIVQGYLTALKKDKS